MISTVLKRFYHIVAWMFRELPWSDAFRPIVSLFGRSAIRRPALCTLSQVLRSYVSLDNFQKGPVRCSARYFLARISVSRARAPNLVGCLNTAEFEQPFRGPVRIFTRKHCGGQKLQCDSPYLCV